VAYTDPNTPATAPSVSLARGATVITADGIDVANGSDVAGLNNAFFPVDTTTPHTFVVLDAGSSVTRTITMTPANVQTAPVQNVGVLSGTTTGYMLFNDHLATAEPALINAINQLKTAGVTDLVVDIRYNGGGYLDIASELAYMIAGPATTTGKTFDAIHFNDKHPSTDPVAGTPIVPTPFYSTAVGLDPSVTAGSTLPYLGLSRVFVLTGSGTCSASEAVINGLVGAGVQVIQVGSSTCGKPYGFYPQDNCGTTYFSIQFQGVNNAGFGNYPDGFYPANSISLAGIDPGAVLPGCSVADDFTHALGDPAEARLAAALTYAQTQSCPAPNGIVRPTLKRSLAATEGQVLKTPALMNRIMRRH
jgi:carboxyl-terminal processing protease